MKLVESLKSDFKFLINASSGNIMGESSLWEKRVLRWFQKLSVDGELNLKKLANFRRNSVLLAEIPMNPLSEVPILRSIYDFVYYEGYRQSCIWNYEKLKDDTSLDWDSFNDIGSPYAISIDGRKFNERSLRHLRSTALVNQYIELNEGDTVLDIGGGYGQFIMQLRRSNPKIKSIIVDFPEQLFLAKYYIGMLDPSLRVNSLESIYQSNQKLEDLERSFDVLLVPVDRFDLLADLKCKLACNFSSFGEMSKKQFLDYFNSKPIKNSEYFFTINRIDSFPTYDNFINVMDYLTDDFERIHLQTSPIWDHYYKSRTPFYVKKHSFLSRNFELLGKFHSGRFL